MLRKKKWQDSNYRTKTSKAISIARKGKKWTNSQAESSRRYFKTHKAWNYQNGDYMKGEKNPMYGKKAWNNGLTKETDERIRKASIKSSHRRVPYVQKICPICNKTFEVSLSAKDKRKTCSLVCSYQLSRIAWNVGIHRKDVTRSKIAKSLKEHFFKKYGCYKDSYSYIFKNLRLDILKRDNFTCYLCKKQISLVVHHIDYNKQNNDPQNLITLCISCHGKTCHNREYWTSYFKSKSLQIHELI